MNAGCSTDTDIQWMQKTEVGVINLFSSRTGCADFDTVVDDDDYECPQYLRK
jgi:hypothetical protein